MYSSTTYGETHTQHKHLIATVEHGGGTVIVWACLSDLHPAVIESTDNQKQRLRRRFYNLLNHGANFVFTHHFDFGFIVV